MLDLRLIRQDPELVRVALRRRGDDGDLARLEVLLVLDSDRRRLQGEVDDLRAERKRAAEEVQRRKRAGEDADDLIRRSSDLRDELAGREEALRAADEELRLQLLALPNLPSPTAAEGLTEEEGEIVRQVGEPPAFGFDARDHLELAGWMIDTERGARTSGSRFAYLLGDIVRLDMAMFQWAVDGLCRRGFTPVSPPVLVRDEALYGTGFFPAERESIYAVERDDLYLVGTSEVPLAALRMGEIVDEDTLPQRFCGVSTCFRREAGAAGRDTRGIFRVHQFDKVEMFSFCHPDRSEDEHEFLLSIEEDMVQALGLVYRVKNVAAGDLGAPAAKKYDIEVWLAGQGRYRELTSCSNTTDYQARRLNARYRSAQGPRMLHTLNGTAVTSSRTTIAILETHQREDGSVVVPEVLRRYGAPETIGPVAG